MSPLLKFQEAQFQITDCVYRISKEPEDLPVCLLLLVLQCSECVLQAIGEDLQLLREFVLLTELFS